MVLVQDLFLTEVGISGWHHIRLALNVSITYKHAVESKLERINRRLKREKGSSKKRGWKKVNNVASI